MNFGKQIGVLVLSNKKPNVLIISEIKNVFKKCNIM